MFKKNNIFKKEILTNFKEKSEKYLKDISDIFLEVMLQYKDEEKIEAIDKVVNAYKNNLRGFSDAFIDLDKLAAHKSDLFYEASDLETNKNEIILIQAEKITLFDWIFKQEKYSEEFPEYSFYVNDSEENIYIFEPILELYYNLIDICDF